TKAQESGKVNGLIQTLTHSSKIHPDVLAKTFTAEKGDMFIVKAEEKAFLVHLKDIKTPTIKTGSPEFKKTADFVEKQFSGMIYDDYMSYLSEKYGVERQDARIQEYFAPKE
ncbi:MAG: hypothetical protein JXQ74_04570, partial [Alphaproteobacteria bacterium]|nr:hypothetical protein [Alphaproteobacteria bacterium]